MRGDRLELRLPVEADRARFVELFGDPDFMVFSGGVLAADQANGRFDGMLARATEFPYAKQPIVELGADTILGYAGVNRFSLNGSCDSSDELEFGYRLVPEARGQGYATEAGRALMQLIEEHYRGEIYAMIDPRNKPSQRVADKLGFTFLRTQTINGYLDRLYVRHFGDRT